MLEDFINNFLPYLIEVFEIMGIFILSIGTFRAFLDYLLNLFRKKDKNINVSFANCMITALDFKLAAEILKTVIVDDFHELFILAIVFILRIIMTFVLEKEIEFENKLDEI